MSGMNNFSQDKRARGQPTGQDSTVAAVSDRQRLLHVCVTGWCQILVWTVTNTSY